MLPLFKVVSLIVRVFSRPLISYTKKYHIGRKNDSHELLRRFFMALGNYYNIMETKINKKFLKINTADEIFIKPLSDDVAVEKGVEFFYEVILYGIMISLPLYEMWSAQESANKKAKELSDRLNKIEDDINKTREKEGEDKKMLEQKINTIEEMLAKSDKTTSEMAAEMKIIKDEIIKYIDLRMTELQNARTHAK